MTLPIATLVNSTTARLEGELYVVIYKHHLDRVPVDGSDITLFQYWARDGKKDRPGTAWEWGETARALIERTRKVIVFEPEWSAGKLYNARSLDSYGEKLCVELLSNSPLFLKIIEGSTSMWPDWSPLGYADPEHLHNHPHLKR